MPVIILTAQGTINSVVEAMKKGVYSYLTKPLTMYRCHHLLFISYFTDTICYIYLQFRKAMGVRIAYSANQALVNR